MTQHLTESGPKGAGPSEPTKPSQAPDSIHRDEGMDKTLADSFPASDPPSSIPNPEDEETAA